MKKHLFAFIFLFATAAWHSAKAQCTWQGVPTGTTAASTSTNTTYDDIAIDGLNQPWIVYCDAANSNLATVRSFTAGTWQTVGATGNTNASYTSLAVTGFTPYIAFVDGNSGSKATVKTYSAGTWTQVGAALSTGTASYTSISLDPYSGTPYVAYQDVANGNKPTVKTYSAGTWVTVGGTTASTVSCSYTYLALDHAGIPYIIYQDVTNGYKASVKKYSGGVWSSVGPTNISTSTASYLSIDFDSNNTPYIAYEESNVATIKTFTAGAWQAVGTGTVANSYTYLNLAIDQNINTPYIGFYQTGSYGAAVSKFSGGAWSYSGNQPFSTSGTTSYNSIAIDHSGIPFVIYNDYGVGASVKKLGTATTISLQPVSSTVTCVNASVPLTVSTTTTTGLFYNWQSNASGTFSNVPGGNTQTMTISPVTATMSGVAYRCVVYDGCVNIISANAMLTVNATPTVTASNYIICNGQTATLLGGGATTYSWNTGATTTSITVAPPTTTTYTLTGFNGPCYAMSYPTVTVNPNPNVTVASASICAGATTTLNASGTATSYYWSTGPATYSLAVSPVSNTVYTVTGTDANGCSTSANATVTVNANPVVVPSSNSPVCEGSSLVLIEGGVNGPVTWYWTGPNAFTSTVQNPVLSSSTPSLSGTYTVAVTNASSCTSTGTVLAIVNAAPAVSLTASSWSICIGSIATISASGANTYTWSTGAISPTIAATPSVNTTYSVSGINSNGCIGSATGTVSMISSKTFSGTVSSTAGAVSGNMILYKYTPTLSMWDSVAFTPFSSIYSFGITDSSLYVIKAVPTATNVQITYAPSAISWQNALVIPHGCTAATTQSVLIKPYTALTGSGSGSMSGHITEASGYGHKTANIEAPGNPIPGVVVKGGKNPGSAIFAETVTDANGLYAFTNVPDNNPGETYFILVDIPGLDTNQTYHEVLVAGNDNYTTLDFTVDSIEVNPVMATSVNEINKADYQVQLFPNPANTSVTLSYSLLKQSAVKIELADLVGKHVGPLQAAVSQPPGNYSQTMPVDMLSPGMYFVRVNIDGKEATIKLCISR